MSYEIPQIYSDWANTPREIVRGWVKVTDHGAVLMNEPFTGEEQRTALKMKANRIAQMYGGIPREMVRTWRSGTNRWSPAIWQRF